MPGSTINHKSAANAGAQRDHAEVFNMLPRPQPLFSHGGAIGIIFQDHRSSQPQFEIIAHRISTPVGEIGSRMNGAALQVNYSGNTYAQPQELVGRRIFVAEEAHGLSELLDHFFAPAAYFGQRVDPLKLRAALVHSGDSQVGASQIDPNGECRHTRLLRKAEPEINYNESFQ